MLCPRSTYGQMEDLGGLELHSLLGQGAFGYVFQGRMDGLEVAVKAILDVEPTGAGAEGLQGGPAAAGQPHVAAASGRAMHQVRWGLDRGQGTMNGLPAEAVTVF